MKTLKYRSAFAGLCIAMLSVFLFTACEKDSDGEPAKEPNRIEKFSRLSFTTEDGSGSASYTGADGNVSFTSASSNSANFTTADGRNSDFTDPRARTSRFIVRPPLSVGGGSVNIGGTDFPMALAICANEDLFDFFDLDGDSSDTDEPEFDLFIGISGDFSFDMEMSDSSDNPLDLLLYIFSYNGGTQLGSFDDFENDDEIGEAAFVIAVEFEDGMEEPNFWFATDGSVVFSGADVLLAGVELTKVDISGDDDAGLTRETVSMTGDLTCVEIDEEEF